MEKFRPIAFRVTPVLDTLHPISTIQRFQECPRPRKVSLILVPLRRSSLPMRNIQHQRHPEFTGSGVQSRVPSVPANRLRHTMRDCGRANAGVTLIEALVAIAVVGILVAILLPAVQSARSTARRAQCQNHVRQICVALGSFEATYGRYPNAYCGAVGTAGAWEYLSWCPSPLAQIACYLDAESECQKINAVKAPQRWDPRLLQLPSPAVARCPDDSFAENSAGSYRFNRGLLPLWPGDPHGVFHNFTGKRAADITDGLSSTAFVSERIISTTDQMDHLRNPLDAEHVLANALASACISLNENNASATAVSQPPLGGNWLSGDWGQSCYYHFFLPNSAWRDCSGSYREGPHLPNARSWHAGGVNVGFGDGHCALISNSIDLSVWRAIGTRDNWELVP